MKSGPISKKKNQSNEKKSRGRINKNKKLSEN